MVDFKLKVAFSIKKMNLILENEFRVHESNSLLNPVRLTMKLKPRF